MISIINPYNNSRKQFHAWQYIEYIIHTSDSTSNYSYSQAYKYHSKRLTIHRPTSITQKFITKHIGGSSC